MLDGIGANLASLRPTETIRRGVASPVSSSAPLQGPEAPDAAQALPVRQPSERWFVVQHEPFFGPTARHHIRRLGFEVHWPRMIVRQARRDDVIVPLFPGYMFALFDVARGGWGEIHRAKSKHIMGVLGVRELGAPIAVRWGEVEKLICRAGAIDAAIDLTGDKDVPEPVVPLEAGAVVMFLDENLFSHPAILHADRGGPRVDILMQMLGAERVVSVPRDRVRAA